METSSPALSKIITMVLFTLSVVGLLLFLWLSFGGVVPLNPKGYRVRISFPNAQELATEADVRIAGVSVGKVIAKELDRGHNATMATIQLQNQYAPIHEDATAILRQKTLLSETYVELTPGSHNSPPVPDNGLLPRGQVQHVVQLSDIFNALDPTTRHAFQVWQQELSVAIQHGNDQNLSNVLGNLPTFAADATDILKVLDIEHAAVVHLVQGGGTVFTALGQNQTALRNLITSADSVFTETANNNNALAQTFHVFPTFLNESKATMQKLQAFSLNTDPVVRALVPVAQDLRPTLHDLKVLSPYLQTLFAKLGPLIQVSKTGLPAYSEVIHGLDHQGCGSGCVLPALGTFLEQLNPILNWLGLHQQLTSDFISNGAYAIAGTTSAFGGSGLTCPTGNGLSERCGHYLRQFGPTGPETFGIYQNRDPNNRGNTYPPPVWIGDPQSLVRGNLPAWDCNNTGGEHGASGSNESCWVAPPLGHLMGQPQKFPHVGRAHYSSRP